MKVGKKYKTRRSLDQCVTGNNGKFKFDDETVERAPCTVLRRLEKMRWVIPRHCNVAHIVKMFDLFRIFFWKFDLFSDNFCTKYSNLLFQELFKKSKMCS